MAELVENPDVLLPGLGLGPQASGAVASSQTGGPTVLGPGPGLRGSASMPSAGRKLRLREDVTRQGQEDGEFLFIVSREPEDLSEPSGTLYVQVDGKQVLEVPFSF